MTPSAGTVYPLFLVKYQAAHLDGLPVRRVLRACRIQECCMRRQPRLPLIRVKTLDQSDLIRRLFPQVVPCVQRVVTYAERGALPIPVEVPRRDEVLLWLESAPVGNRKGMVCNGVPDGPPHVDDAHAALEQAISIFGSVMAYPGQGRGIRLIDVHARLGERRGSMRPWG
jgi:hypothetical protein